MFLENLIKTRKGKIVFAFASCVVFFLYTFLYYKVFSRIVPINSDWSVMVMYADDILHGNIFRKGWILSSINFLTTDLLYFIMGTAIFGISQEAFFLANALMYAVYVATAFFVLSKKINYHKILALLLFTLVLAIPFLMAVHCVHTGCYMYVIISFYLVDLVLNENYHKKILYILITVLLVLGSFGDELVILLGIAPIAVLCIIRLLKGGDKKKYVYLLLCVVAALLFTKVLSKFYFLIGRAEKGTLVIDQIFYSSNDLFQKNIPDVINGIFSLFNADFFGKKLVSIRTPFYFVKVLIIIIGVLLIYKSIKKEIVEKNQNYLLSLFSMSSLFILSIIFLSTFSIGGPRYYSFILCSFVFVLTLNFNNTVIDRKIYLSICTLLLLCCIEKLNTLYNDCKYKRIPPQEKLAGFLVEKGLTNGLAPFWSAAVTTVCSKGQITVGAVLMSDENISMYHYYCNKKWFDSPANFILFDKNAEGDFGVTKERIVKICGEPKEYYEVDNYCIYIYEKDLIKNMQFKPSFYRIKVNTNSESELDGLTLYKGFYYREQWGTWTKDCFSIKTDFGESYDAEKDLIVIFTAHSYHVDHDVDVYVNDVFVDTVTIPQYDKSCFVKLDRNLLKNNENEFSFYIKGDIYRPIDVTTDNKDERVLGIGLINFCVAEK